MMPRITPHLVSAAIAGVLLLAAVVNAGLSNPVVARTGRLTFKGEPLVQLKAAKPDIGPFEEFNVNDDNPFIPWADRQDQNTKIRKRNFKAPPADPTPPFKPLPTRPRLTLPRLVPTVPEAPHAMGLIGTANQAVVLVRSPDSQTSVPVPIGGTINGWTLIAVEDGNRAVWEEPSGTRHTFLVGEAALNDAQQLVTAAAADGTKGPAVPPKPATDKNAPKPPPIPGDVKRPPRKPGDKSPPNRPVPPDKM